MDEIIATAKNYFETTSKLSCPKSVAPSDLWQITLDNDHLKTINTAKNFREVIDVVTRENYFTVSTLNTDPILPRLITGFENWLIQSGRPLDSLDLLLQESPYTSKDVLITRGNRKVSSGFF